MNQSIWSSLLRPLLSHEKKHTATRKITNTSSGSCLLQRKSDESSKKMAASSWIWAGRIAKVHQHVRFTNTSCSSNFATKVDFILLKNCFITIQRDCQHQPSGSRF